MRVCRPRLMPRATIQKVMCGAISRPSLNGTRPGLIVSKTHSPVSMSVALRPQPAKFGSAAPRISDGRVVEPVGIRLPDLDQRILERRAGAVEHPGAHGDALALGLVVDHAGAEIVFDRRRRCRRNSASGRYGRRARRSATALSLRRSSDCTISCPPGGFRTATNGGRAARCRTCRRARPSGSSPCRSSARDQPFDRRPGRRSS